MTGDSCRKCHTRSIAIAGGIWVSIILRLELRAKQKDVTRVTNVREAPIIGLQLIQVNQYNADIQSKR